MSKSHSPRQLVIDDEIWEVTALEPGHFRFTWISGIAGGSGFTYRLSNPDFDPPIDMIEAAIRDYMSEINPDTGYLD